MSTGCAGVVDPCQEKGAYDAFAAHLDAGRENCKRCYLGLRKALMIDRRTGQSDLGRGVGHFVMDSPPLVLLLPDGAVRVTFEPDLDPNAANYEQLLHVSNEAHSSLELQQSLRELSGHWGVAEIQIDPL